MSFTPILVTGTFTLADGTPAAGAVDFLLTHPLTDSGTGARIPATTITAALDPATGTFSVALVATDDPSTTPVGATYLVTERITGTDLGPGPVPPPPRTYFVTVPAAAPGGTIALGRLVPVATLPALTYGLSGVVAIPPLAAVLDQGVVTIRLDSSNFTTDADLAAETAARVAADSAHAGQTTSAHGGIVASTDPRLADARVPTAHATSHGSGGSDPVTPAAIGASATGHTHTHAGTTGQTADDHHAKSHGHTGADGSGTVAHGALTSVGPDDHHAKSHSHTGSDGSGTVAYPDLTSKPTIPALSSTTPALPTLAGTVGVGTTSARADHSHPTPWLAPAKVGDYLVPPVSVSTGTRVNGQLVLVPLVLTQAQTVDQLIFEIVTTPGSAGALTRLGIYSSGSDGRPSALVLDGGTVDSTTTGVKTLTITATPLAAGVYWLAAVQQGSPATQPVYRTNLGALPGISAESATTAMQVVMNGYYKLGVTGALPASLTSFDGATNTTIRLACRVSA